MKKVLAVLVSIFWLALIVGIPALVLTGNAGRLIPVQVRDQMTQLVGQDLLARFDVAGNEPTPAIDEPIVVAETVTPAPAVEPTVAATEPPPPTPITEAQPTATPQPTSTPAATLPEIPTITIPVAVRGQAELRTGPGPEFDSVGLVDAGATVLVAAQDETGEWFLMDDGNWIPGEALASKPAVPILLPAPAVTPEAAPTEAPAIETPATPAAPVVVKVNGDSNLRSGPGGTFDRVGGVTFGSDVNVVGKFATDNWYLLDTGSWIFGVGLESAPDVPQVNADGTPVGSAPAPSPAPSTAPAPAATAAPGATTASPTANNIANLRAAPNTSAAITGSTIVGQALVVAGKNAAGDWLKLDSGSWIFSGLVDNAPADLPVAAEDGAAGSATTTTAAQPPLATPITATVPTTTTVTTTTPTEATPATTTPETNGDSNLRAGPGQSFDIVGSVLTGTALTLIGRNEAGDWLKLQNGAWIFGALVDNAPADLPVAAQ